MAAWALVRDPDDRKRITGAACALARAACPLEPKNITYSNSMLWALGVAQYRCGLLAEALATFTRIKALSEEGTSGTPGLPGSGPTPPGAVRQARITLGRLREMMKNPQWSARNPEAQGFLREAETIGSTGSSGRPVRALIPVSSSQSRTIL